MMKFIVIYTLFICCVAAEDLKVCVQSQLKDMDIHQSQNQITIEVLHKKIYESLIRYDKSKQRFYGLLLKEIKIKSTTEILLVIKKNVSFQSNKYFKPTKKLSAKDIIFNFNRIKSEQDIPFFNNLVSIEKVTNLVVSLKSKEPFTSIYESLSYANSSIASSEYYNFLKKRNKLKFFYTEPIGTGPYQLSSIQSGVVRLKKNPQYHRSISHIKKITYQKINSIELRNLKACDIVSFPRLSSIKLADKEIFEIYKTKNLYTIKIHGTYKTEFYSSLQVLDIIKDSFKNLIDINQDYISLNKSLKLSKSKTIQLGYQAENKKYLRYIKNSLAKVKKLLQSKGFKVNIKRVDNTNRSKVDFSISLTKEIKSKNTVASIPDFKLYKKSLINFIPGPHSDDLSRVFHTKKIKRNIQSTGR